MRLKLQEFFILVIKAPIFDGKNPRPRIINSLKLPQLQNETKKTATLILAFTGDTLDILHTLTEAEAQSYTSLLDRLYINTYNKYTRLN